MLLFVILFPSCTTTTLQRKETKNPSLEYSKNLQKDIKEQREHELLMQEERLKQYDMYAANEENELRAKYHFINNDGENQNQYEVKNLSPVQEDSFNPERPKYKGPLFYGDAGRSPSLWEESKTGGNDLFRDDRAWLPGDLVTILITEKTDAKGEADTNTKSTSTFLAGIKALLGIDKSIAERNTKLDPATAISTNTATEFKGEADTSRKSTLTAKISAMVVEVLPTGLLRVEGEKIVAVNAEEQIIKISGIVRPKDVNSENEIDSSKLGNMRVDYYGEGVMQDVQTPGWGTRLLQAIWPF